MEAVSWDEGVPNFLSRSTVGNFERHLNRVEDETAPDTDVGPNVHWHVPVPSRDKYAEILR